jgi:glycosyltransferase involved in cell wall biosynthesis
VRLLGAAGVGPAGARAVAFQASRGALIAVHDADDESLPDRIERQVAYLGEHPEIGVLGTCADVIDGRGRIIAAYRVPHGDGALRRMLRRAPPFVHGSVLMRREAYEEAGGFRAVFRCAEDYDLWLRIPPRFGLENLHLPLYRWRSHEGGTFARMRDQHIRFQAAARAFDEERRAVGRDAAALLASSGDWESFLGAYDRADRLALRLGEALVREGRTADARDALVRAMNVPRSLAAALAWWLLSWPVGLLPRARRHARHRAADPAPGRGGSA